MVAIMVWVFVSLKPLIRVMLASLVLLSASGCGGGGGSDGITSNSSGSIGTLDDTGNLVDDTEGSADDIEGSADDTVNVGTGSDLPAGEPLGLVLPRVSIEARELAVIINTDDPLSLQIAEYYVAARNIPQQNVLRLAMGVVQVMSAEVFAAHETAINEAFGEEIEAIALTSMYPHRIECMSVSAAVALGFDLQYCKDGPSCGQTAAVDYFESWSSHPWRDHGLRPTMIIAADTYAAAVALIDRGVAADATYPDAKGWLVRTTDVERSVRSNDFAATRNTWQGVLDLEYVDNSAGAVGSDLIENQAGVLFYFTGLSRVDNIDTNTYHPGAVADHLTSFGGSLPDSPQMSIIEWLQAGVTASYGAVVEPCNYTEKFPQASILIPHYFRGESVVEAYWKSVHWPGEGNFVGEPLARPWVGAQTSYADGNYTVTTTLLRPGLNYAVESGPTKNGPWTPVMNNINVGTWGMNNILIKQVKVAWYRLVEE
ncbi:MAG: hypothetical protein ACJAZ0_002781 [Halioglobus sp.]|jgi:uncharacterized protein (TIGR03790 family)